MTHEANPDADLDTLVGFVLRPHEEDVGLAPIEPWVWVSGDEDQGEDREGVDGEQEPST